MNVTSTISKDELAQHIIDALELEITHEKIVYDAPLFGYDHPDSLGLDSIDALEIALIVGLKYNVHIKADDEKNLEIFSSLNSLAKFIEREID